METQSTSKVKAQKGLTCIVTPVKQKKSNFKRQIIIWYHWYIAENRPSVSPWVRCCARLNGIRTLHFWIGSHNVENSPTAPCQKMALDQVHGATHPNSAYSCLTKKSITAHDTPMTHGATMRYGWTRLHRLPGPSQV